MELSTLEFTKAMHKWSHILQIGYFPFKVIQQTAHGQTKMLFKKQLIVLVLLIHGYEAYFEYLGLILSISRHGIKHFLCVRKCCTGEEFVYANSPSGSHQDII